MSDRQFEHTVRDWLEAGSDRTPPAAIDAVLLAVKTTPQERDLRIPRRFRQMPTYMRLAAGIAIVAVLGVGALVYFNPSPGFGGPGTPTPSPTPTLQPSATAFAIPELTTFTSARYGYSIDYPTGLAPQPATSDWPAGVTLSTGSAFIDRLVGSSDHATFPNAFLGLASQPLPAGMSAGDWMTEHAERNLAVFGEACGGKVEDWVPTTVLGEAGRRVAATCLGGSVSELVFTHNGRGWAITGDTSLVDLVLQSFQLSG